MADPGAAARFVLTGAPGSGKTSVLHALAGLGFQTVPEAATDVIAQRQAAGEDEPWRTPDFVERIAALQRDRQREADLTGAGVQVYDRSPVCTLALARHLGHPVPALLAAEIERVGGEVLYRRQVFFIRPLGFIQPTAARRIGYAESLAFERVHEAAYLRLGFELVDIPAAPVPERAAAIAGQIRRLADKPYGRF